ncbi:hypothetical protein Poli38472_013209 [Pythium oligandrum]|uniref:Uncharacterized protein n=1 Tax=Pythium oligandrum TaxID=41045 RepID=A0A8K1FDX8_PYTOL|nr:hypothetical protein Poli38472_013209 [Pythium oligandrum]|eukprot:TMW55318.1 hypothetical protein Poli38472_013209 [Pythium oligandrum]
MARSGGCTASIFWRLEEHNVVKWLLRGWSLNSLIDRDDDKIPGSLIIEGSPGIGKSTLLCLMAFHLVFKYKKRVFVYRSLGTAITALFYLGYEENETIDGEGKKVMTFHLENCGDTVARMIYDSLTQQYGPIWLLLDGFEKSRPPKDTRDFRLLSTSQQVDIKDRETEFMRACLLSAWTMNDLFKLGREAYGLMTEEMGERYYYTGGNARQFVRFREDKWCEQIHDRIAIAGKPPVRRSASDNDLIHELWRSIVKLDVGTDTSNVAFLQITVADKLDIDGKQLEAMNELFPPSSLDSTTEGNGGMDNEDDPKKPLYITVCPDLASCQALILHPPTAVDAARMVCRVYVGYYDQFSAKCSSSGPLSVPPTALKAIPRYNRRPNRPPPPNCGGGKRKAGDKSKAKESKAKIPRMPSQ